MDKERKIIASGFVSNSDRLVMGEYYADHGMSFEAGVFQGAALDRIHRPGHRLQALTPVPSDMSDLGRDPGARTVFKEEEEY